MPYTTRLACTLGKREDMLCEVDPKIDNVRARCIKNTLEGTKLPSNRDGICTTLECVCVCQVLR